MTDPKITDEEELDEEGNPVKPDTELSEILIEGGETEPPKKTVEEKEEEEIRVRNYGTTIPLLRFASKS